MLDVFLDFEFDPRFRLRAGRFKTPFTYEFLVDPVQGLIQPERSIFFNNFGQNRDVGGMLYGRLFDNHLDYAVGLWNGFRNGFIDNNDGKAVSAYLNYMPFRNSEGSIFQNLDIVQGYGADYILVLAGDHIYKMDYELMLQQHVDTKADVTIGCLEVPREEATGFGVMHVDTKDRITAFVEKPNKWLHLAGVIALGSVVFIILLAGVLSLHYKTIASTLPFIVLCLVYFTRFRFK